MNCILSINKVEKETCHIQVGRDFFVFTHKGTTQKYTYNNRYIKLVSQLNSNFLATAEDNSLIFQVFNKLNMNTLSYVAFFIGELNELIKQECISSLTFKEKVPTVFYFPIAHYSGDASFQLPYDNRFLLRFLVKGLNVRKNYKTARVLTLRPYFIFSIKFLLCWFYKILEVLFYKKEKEKEKDTLVVLRSTKSLDFIKSCSVLNGIDYGSVLIPSFNIRDNFLMLINRSKLAMELLDNSSRNKAYGELFISKDLKLSVAEIERLYSFEEYDKYVVYRYFKNHKYRTIYSFDLLNEYGFYIQQATSDSRFIQSYAITLERSAYLPNFQNYYLNSNHVIDRFKSFGIKGTFHKLTVASHKYINKTKITRIVVITQPNLAFKKNFFPLEELLEMCKEMNIELRFKIHPRDTSNYNSYNVEDFDRRDQSFNQQTIFLGFNSYMLFELFKQGLGFIHCDHKNYSNLEYIKSINQVKSLEHLREICMDTKKYNQIQEELLNELA